MKRGLSLFTLLILLVLPLATVAAQWPTGGKPSRLEHLSPWKRDGYDPETRAWGSPEMVRRAETAHPTSFNWQTERVDAPKIFSNMGPHSLALDASGHPHIAYGGDHLYYAWHDGSYWHLETVDASEGVGEYTSLVLDAADRPHISYYDATNGNLKYVHFNSSSWQVETVDSTGDVGYDTSLALDASSQPHISYFDTINDDLKYAHFNGSAWLTETVDSAGLVGYDTALALDAAGQPHISYLDGSNSCLKYAYFDGIAWQVEVVGSGWGYDTALALDAASRPHISYCLSGGPYGCTDLKYVHFDGAMWQVQTVDSAGDVGESSSLTLSSSGWPHISYRDITNNALKYAHFDGSIWQIETVDSIGDVGYDTSLALDTSDQPHISYFDWTNDDLKHAHFDGNAWQVQTVDGTGDVGANTSLALDGIGRAHISYYDVGNRDLKYAYFDGNTWQIETVDSAGNVGKYTSLALDRNGRPHISYCLYDPFSRHCEDLKYAHFDGTAWQIETVDSTGDVGDYTSLALDASDHPHISYYDHTNNDLKYTHFGSSAWQIEIVDSVGNVGMYTFLALDASDSPHISYYDFTNGGLKYARFDSAYWQIETVDSTGGYTSLALDGRDRPHISYLDFNNVDLKYARFNGASWQIETVDSAGNVGYYTSLALDTADRPHISYFDHTNYGLKHAHFDGSAWQVETVDSTGDVGYYTSLAIDASDQPHISYYDDTNGDLKYARQVGWDSGFRPNPHGYSFSNSDPRWGHYPQTAHDFQIEELIRMFGQEAVCLEVTPTCRFRPTADQWHRQANRLMNGGHCDGFTTTGLRFFKGLDNLADFQDGASTVHDLLLENICRHIAYYWVLQIPNPVAAARGQALENTPAEVLEQIRSTIAGGFADPTTLIVYNPTRTSGHSVTPYMVEDRGSGIYWIWVYDNNYPDDANRHVEVNTTADTWSYDLGGDIGTWSGDASSHSLGAIPISTYAQSPQCPWCDGACVEGATQRGQTWLSGGGHLLITDSQGRRIGYVGDQFVSEVPGAFGTVPPGGLGLPAEPIYNLPVTETYTILLDGQTLTQTGTAALTQFGPGYAVQVADVALEPDSQDHLAFSPDGTELAYRSGNDEEASLLLALDGVAESYQWQVQGADVEGGQVVTLTVDTDNGRLILNNTQAGGGEYGLVVQRVDPESGQCFVHAGVVISATDTHYLDYGAWDGFGSMTLYVDHGSDGMMDKTLVLDNQVMHVYLPLIMKGY